MWIGSNFLQKWIRSANNTRKRINIEGSYFLLHIGPLPLTYASCDRSSQYLNNFAADTKVTYVKVDLAWTLHLNNKYIFNSAFVAGSKKLNKLQGTSAMYKEFFTVEVRIFCTMYTIFVLYLTLKMKGQFYHRKIRVVNLIMPFMQDETKFLSNV